MASAAIAERDNIKKLASSSDDLLSAVEDFAVKLSLRVRKQGRQMSTGTMGLIRQLRWKTGFSALFTSAATTALTLVAGAASVAFAWLHPILTGAPCSR